MHRLAIHWQAPVRSVNQYVRGLVQRNSTQVVNGRLERYLRIYMKSCNWSNIGWVPERKLCWTYDPDQRFIEPRCGSKSCILEETYRESIGSGRFCGFHDRNNRRDEPKSRHGTSEGCIGGLSWISWGMKVQRVISRSAFGRPLRTHDWLSIIIKRGWISESSR